MAGNSFTDGRFQSRCVNLDHVNRDLQWNPYPRDREATQHFWWDTVSESIQLHRNEENPLECAKRCAEARARLLSQYHKGRILLDAEETGEYGEDPKFWFARAGYYQVEYEKLEEEDHNRASRSMTPEVIHPDFFGENELDRAKGHAKNAAGLLATLPAGKALLEAEDHGNSATDPDYWWSKEKYYEVLLKTELEKTELERVKRSADEIARRLATFPAGKALIEAEDHGDSATDPEYWSQKKEYYWDEYRKLKQEFWDRWKQTHLGGGGSPSETLNNSRPRTRARQPSAIKERCTTRSTRSITQQRKQMDRVPLDATTCGSNSYTGFNKVKDAHSTGRRKSKGKYRHHNAHVIERKPPSSPSCCSAVQSPSNGYTSPKSDISRTPRVVIKERCEHPAERRCHKVTDPNSDGKLGKSQLLTQNPYVTPSSPDFSVVRARQRRKPKGTIQQKRRRDTDRAYRGLKTVLQPFQPISSRLRSSGHLRQREAL